MVRGRPVTMSRPRISISSLREPGNTVPILILIFSDVRSPIKSLYSRFNVVKNFRIKLIASHFNRGRSNDVAH